MLIRDDVRAMLLKDLNDDQVKAVESLAQKTLIIAGAGSGKTEVMARKIAYWVGIEGVQKDRIIAFTFTERAAEEMKFRIRRWLLKIAPHGEDATLGGMFVGTIHAFCLMMLRELDPDRFHNFDILDEPAKLALIQKGFYSVLGLKEFEEKCGKGHFEAITLFARAYDLLNEYDELDVVLPQGKVPHEIENEAAWCKQASMKTSVGDSALARAFATSASRFYAYLLCRRFLDFSTSQSELVRLLRLDERKIEVLNESKTHIVVDEVQDINPVQYKLINYLVGERGCLTAVGDHRQAIYRFRGSRVEVMSELARKLQAESKCEVIELKHNYRSTPRIIEIANNWAKKISHVGSLTSADMEHGRNKRSDLDASHIAALSFDDRQKEASWISETIHELVNPSTREGALHDSADGERGLVHSDIAILLRTSSDARQYMSVLEQAGIPAVFRAGPDLFAQPEVLLFIGALGRAVNIGYFQGDAWGPSLPNYIKKVLGCGFTPKEVIEASCNLLARDGLITDSSIANHLILVSDSINCRLNGNKVSGNAISQIRTKPLAAWLKQTGDLRRVFPQALFHWLLAEAKVENWDNTEARGRSALFHIGQLSSQIKGMETPGWNDPQDFKYQVIALCLMGAKIARTNEAPLLVSPDAVLISTVHSAKGLEFPVIFLADVCAQRFPSKYAKSEPGLPFDGEFTNIIRASDFADNENYDDERRLMYVALTRSERYLFVSCSGKNRSLFFKEVSEIISQADGAVKQKGTKIPQAISLRPSEICKVKVRLITTFSDIRYYLECPHDFYLRKVLGFAPTIDQAFGYGRGIHNLLRAIHSDPKHWAQLQKNRKKLEAEIEKLIHLGMFYLRYTTGGPRLNMEMKAKRVVADYVERYSGELDRLQYEPERAFELLLPDDDILISGVIDIIRLDDPPRVTLIDFKSGNVESDILTKLDREEMEFQISLYGLAAKRELEYEPDQGLVRYLGEEDPTKSELKIPLDEAALDIARRRIIDISVGIRDRKFHEGPSKGPRDSRHKVRCAECDFREFCGTKQAKKYRETSR